MGNNTKGGGAKNGVAAAVREFLSDHPGREIYISQLVRALPRYTVTQIRGGINHRIAMGDPIERVIMGSCWRWHAPTAAAPMPPADQPMPPTPNIPESASPGEFMMVQIIGTLTGGEAIWQDTDTKILYRVTKL